MLTVLALAYCLQETFIKNVLKNLSLRLYFDGIILHLNQRRLLEHGWLGHKQPVA